MFWDNYFYCAFENQAITFCGSSSLSFMALVILKQSLIEDKQLSLAEQSRYHLRVYQSASYDPHLYKLPTDWIFYIFKKGTTLSSDKALSNEFMIRRNKMCLKCAFVYFSICVIVQPHLLVISWTNFSVIYFPMY